MFVAAPEAEKQLFMRILPFIGGGILILAWVLSLKKKPAFDRWLIRICGVVMAASPVAYYFDLKYYQGGRHLYTSFWLFQLVMGLIVAPVVLLAVRESWKAHKKGKS